ncbi:GGDEF domain-containing protein [Allohahella sp. A8]|uniref:GGDEF domain-containing protein n=1 Tax=Allohahella sp. A8 TaxID=3141461 RepID=UPI0026882911|tara:strand:+ start:16638 stop:17600 length:963 start_codon:yes stop_codon:yes gene_type:complete
MTAPENLDAGEFHWLMDMLQTIDVGLVVLDRSYRVQAWNSFMENHSGKKPHAVRDKVIFDLFTEIPKDWFFSKTQAVFLLQNRTFTTWTQRPYLFRFRNYRPITGTEPYMFQNITISPLISASGQVDHICLIIYDVTDIATNSKQLQAANDKLGYLSRTDALTGLNNRGAWQESLKAEYSRHKRTGQNSTLVMFDIDHFKKVNDTYGHPAGDEVIKKTASVLLETMRETDISGRYGGEEFTIILVDTPPENAMIFAERLRKKIEALTVHHEGTAIRWTISLGIAPVDDSVTEPMQWVEHADQALYKSKQGGRNRSTHYAP